MFRFLKTAIFNGLLILLPILFLIIILKEFAELFIGLATPLADLFPRDAIESIPETNILAVLLILGAALLIGIISMIPIGASIGRRIEQRTLDKLPVYTPLKSLLQALLGSETSNTFKPAFIIKDNGELEPAYIVEDSDWQRLVMLVPWTPASFAGSLRIVPRDRVYKLDLTLDQFSLAIGHYGVGLSKLFPDIPEELRLKPDED